MKLSKIPKMADFLLTDEDTCTSNIDFSTDNLTRDYYLKHLSLAKKIFFSSVAD